jgi:transcription elongation GreA/GreB family factor
MNIDKKKVVIAIILEIEKELQVAINAAKSAHEDATNEESKPENEYDTRALEASYVARGQAKRVTELQEALFKYKNLELKDFAENDPIAATALIEVECLGKKMTLFYMSVGGGFSIVVDGLKIQVVTPSTPLGESLLQMRAGDSVFVELGKSEREYEILKVM